MSNSSSKYHPTRGPQGSFSALAHWPTRVPRPRRMPDYSQFYSGGVTEEAGAGARQLELQ